MRMPMDAEPADERTRAHDGMIATIYLRQMRHHLMSKTFDEQHRPARGVAVLRCVEVDCMCGPRCL